MRVHGKRNAFSDMLYERKGKRQGKAKLIVFNPSNELMRALHRYLTRLLDHLYKSIGARDVLLVPALALTLASDIRGAFD